MKEMLLPYRAALYRPVVKVVEAGDDLDAGDAPLYRQLFTDLL